MRKTSSNRSIAKSAIALGLAAALTACSSTAASSAVASSAAPSEAASGTEASEDEVWLPYDENFEKKRDERDATGKTGAVASCNWYASKAGLDILKEGGNAVINIHSIYKDAKFESDTEYECGAGKILGGVALRGTVAKL